MGWSDPRLAGVLAAAFVAAGPQAHAEPRDERPRVSISFSGCDEALSREAGRIAAIELRAALVETSSDQATTAVTATCSAEATELQVTDPTTGKWLQRSVALSAQAPAARARLLALAIAELVAASWSELEARPEPVVPPATPLAPAPAREAARNAIMRAPVELAAVAEGRLLSSHDLLPGGGARLALWLSRTLFLRADAIADYAVLARASGTVAASIAGASAGLGASLENGWLRAGASLGVRAGYAWMNGIPLGAPIAGYRYEGPWLAPELAVDATLWPRARLSPVLSLSLGEHVVGLKGSIAGDRDVDVSGFWGAVSVAAALR